MYTNAARAIVCLCLSLFMQSVSFAATIYAQTPTVDSSALSDVHQPKYAAEIFTLASADTVRSITWRGLYGIFTTLHSVPATDDFTINFYLSAGGTPGSLLQSFSVGNSVGRTDTGVDLVGVFDIFDYQADIGAGIALGPGDYWISIFNDTSGTGAADDDWSWAVKANDTFVHAQSDDLINWTGSPLATDAHFALDNQNISPIPIPAAVWLFGSALGLLGWMRRKTA